MQQPALLLGMTDHFPTQDDCTTVMCLTMSCCPMFLCVTVTKTCPACKMEHRHILSGLTVILLVGGLGVVDQHFGVVSVQRGSVPIECKNGR